MKSQSGIDVIVPNVQIFHPYFLYTLHLRKSGGGLCMAVCIPSSCPFSILTYKCSHSVFPKIDTNHSLTSRSVRFTLNISFPKINSVFFVVPSRNRYQYQERHSCLQWLLKRSVKSLTLLGCSTLINSNVVSAMVRTYEMIIPIVMVFIKT